MITAGVFLVGAMLGFLLGLLLAAILQAAPIEDDD
jgi:hypothetical protein